MGNSFTFTKETFFCWSIGMYNGPILFTNETSKEMATKTTLPKTEIKTFRFALIPFIILFQIDSGIASKWKITAFFRRHEYSELVFGDPKSEMMTAFRYRSYFQFLSIISDIIKCGAGRST